MKKKVKVNDKMQKGYTYYRIEPKGQNFDEEFNLDLSAKKILELGVFGVNI